MQELTAIKTGTRQEIVTNELRRAILGGLIEPGAKLNEAKLAAELDVSRGPLREAIRELVQVGLIETKSFAGARVCRPNEKYVNDLYQIRLPLERLAYELVWDLRDEDFHNELKVRYKNLKESANLVSQWEQIKAEMAFHSLAFERCQNEILNQTWRNIADRLSLSFAVHQQVLIPAKEYENAHEAFIICALGDDLEAMLAEIEAHIKRGKEITRLRFEPIENVATSKESQ